MPAARLSAAGGGVRGGAALRSMYRVHDEKDKAFQLELSWVCEESGWEHKPLPRDLQAEAEAAGAAALEEAAE